MSDKLRHIIKTKLALIDAENKKYKGSISSFSTSLSKDLQMIRIALDALELPPIEYDINPYFWEDGIPSSIKEVD